MVSGYKSTARQSATPLCPRSHAEMVNAEFLYFWNYFVIKRRSRFKGRVCIFQSHLYSNVVFPLPSSPMISRLSVSHFVLCIDFLWQTRGLQALFCRCARAIKQNESKEKQRKINFLPKYVTCQGSL